jgi:hypothetical protein
LVLLWASGCDLMPQVSPVDGEERDQVLALAEPVADNLLQAMNTADYPGFSRDFDNTMKKSLDEKGFKEMLQFFNPKIGAYVSREVEKVEHVDTLYVVTYNAKFEQEESVAVRLSLRQGDPIQVAGLYFDSPKLREKTSK